MESLFVRDNYIGFISDPSLPFGQQVSHAFQGDRQEENYLNISQKSLIRVIDQTLREGHTLVWMGDTTEANYSGNAGYAYWPTGSDHSPQARKQEMADGKTTPDHCMQIIGKAYTANAIPETEARHDNTFYICKNSTGESSKDKGFFYLSANYIRMKTVALYRHR